MTTIPDPAAAPERTMRMVAWIVWSCTLAGLVLAYALLARGPEKASPPEDVLINLAGLAPLFISIVIRWLVLPRYASLTRGFPAFVLGVGLAEAGGFLGLFLGGSYRDDLFVLGALGVTQFLPLFLARFGRPDKGQFIPNN